MNPIKESWNILRRHYDEKAMLAGAWDALREAWCFGSYDDRKQVLCRVFDRVLETKAYEASRNLREMRLAGNGADDDAALESILALAREGLMQKARRLHERKSWLTRFWPALFVGGIVLLAVFLFSGWWLKRVISPEGLEVVYYHGRDFEKQAACRYENHLIKDYAGRRPAWNVSRETFSARWKGYLVVPETGNYSFHCQSDDGLRLYIDDQLIVDNWREQGWAESARRAHCKLEAGLHPILVEHFNAGGNAGLRVRWAGGPIPDNTVLSTPYLCKRVHETVQKGLPRRN